MAEWIRGVKRIIVVNPGKARKRSGTQISGGCNNAVYLSPVPGCNRILNSEIRVTSRILLKIDIDIKFCLLNVARFDRGEYL